MFPTRCRKEMQRSVLEITDMEETETAPTIGVRHVQMGFMFLMLFVGIGMRTQLSVAIVAMTDNTTSSNPGVPTYDWDNKSVILSSFYWGYVWLQVFAAELGRKYGPKRFLLGAIFVNSSAVLMVPIMAAELGSYGVIGCRIVMGLAQGFFYASIQNILSNWTPSTESSRLLTLAYAGDTLGTIITIPVVGYISSSWLGWPFTFYLYGSLGYAWIIIYFIFGASSPRDHRSISRAERYYIEKHLDIHGSQRKTPWKSILTSAPVWAVLITQMGSAWGNNILITEMPNYMNKVMGFDIESNGLLSAAPHLCYFLLSFVFAYIADYVINCNYLSRTSTRNIATAIAMLGPAITLLVLSFLPDDARNWSVVMLIATIGIQATSNGGYSASNIDLSPNFAGIIMGICNSCGNFVSIFGPLAVQLIVTDETDKAQWKIIFIISAVLFIIPNIFYLLFSSGEKQPWDSPKNEREDVQLRSRKKTSVISIVPL